MWLYGTWLQDSNEEPADKPVIEEYLNNPREVSPKAVVNCCLYSIEIRKIFVSPLNLSFSY